VSREGPAGEAGCSSGINERHDCSSCRPEGERESGGVSAGGPVASVLGWAGVPREQLIVVHDDMDMDFGRIRIRWDGGDGGHKGVRSVTETLGSPFFYRIKVGIGRDPVMAPEDYVLSRFPKDQVGELVEVVDRVVDAIQTFVYEGKEKAMNVYNRA